MSSSIRILIYSKERILRGKADEICRGDACYYLCDDYESFLNVRKRLSDRVEVRLLGDAFHRTLQEISGKYLAFSHRINVRNQSHAFWGTHLASRNSGAIPLLKHIVYFFCAKKLIEQSAARIVFICDSQALIRLIGDEAGIHGLGCRAFLTPLEKLKPSWSAARLFLKGAYFLISGILQVLYSRTLKNERITDAPAGERYVLRSWVTAGSLDAGGRYRDRNFGELPDYLVRAGKGGLDDSPLFQPRSQPLRADETDVPKRVSFHPSRAVPFDFGYRQDPSGRGAGPFPGSRGLRTRWEETPHALVTEIHRTVSLHPSYLSYNSIRYLLEKFARRRIRIDCFIYPAGKQSPREILYPGRSGALPQGEADRLPAYGLAQRADGRVSSARGAILPSFAGETRLQRAAVSRHSQIGGISP